MLKDNIFILSLLEKREDQLDVESHRKQNKRDHENVMNKNYCYGKEHVLHFCWVDKKIA